MRFLRLALDWTVIGVFVWQYWWAFHSYSLNFNEPLYIASLVSVIVITFANFKSAKDRSVKPRLTFFIVTSVLVLSELFLTYGTPDTAIGPGMIFYVFAPFVFLALTFISIISFTKSKEIKE